MFSSPSLICVDYYFTGSQNSTTLCINNNKNIYSIGYSDYNSHGHKEKNIVSITKIQGLTNIKMISCGDCHTVFLNYGGDIFTLGRNNFGQLGIGKTKVDLLQTHIPQKINIPPCKQVSCGNFFTCCISEDGNLYSFGHNYYGQLGFGNKNNYNAPQLVPEINNIKFSVCGGYHIICKTYNNDFYSWGHNAHGQLGNGNYVSHSTPIQCLNWPDNIIDIKCGYNHSLLLTLEGQVYSFGNNKKNGRLGINDKNIEKKNTPTLIPDIPEIQRITCGDFHSMCIDINNNLLVFGSNEFGQLGLGDKENRFKPFQHPTLSDIIDISSRGNHTFVKTIDNKIYAFGYNNHSQLGIETSEKHQLTPVQVLKDNEDIWCSFIGKSKAKSARK